jgi:hypothetical protein
MLWDILRKKENTAAFQLDFKTETRLGNDIMHQSFYWQSFGHENRFIFQ